MNGGPSAPTAADYAHAAATSAQSDIKKLEARVDKLEKLIKSLLEKR